MSRRILGQSGLEVSQLCFGALTIGPLQRNLSVEQGAALIRHALECGVNFIDTAELYGTYPHIRRALLGWDGDVVVATKSYCYEKNAMEASLERARRELDLDVIPLFLLHEQESEHTIRGHWPALEVLLKAKSQGKVLAVGLSTHYVQAVRAGTKIPEIDVISPLINMSGIGIQGGSRDEMLEAIAAASRAGKGIYAMKPLGGGHLISKWRDALHFMLDQKSIDAIAIGVKSITELQANIAFFNGEIVDDAQIVEASSHRKLHIDDWCVGCGECVQACPNQALFIEDGRAHCLEERCVFCGYCGARCREFAIKVI